MRGEGDYIERGPIERRPTTSSYVPDFRDSSPVASIQLRSLVKERMALVGLEVAL